LKRGKSKRKEKKEKKKMRREKEKNSHGKNFETHTQSKWHFEGQRKPDTQREKIFFGKKHFPKGSLKGVFQVTHATSAPLFFHLIFATRHQLVL
jgi:hypothetical protein